MDNAERLNAFAAGKLYEAWELLGSHPVPEGGVRFAVWAPNARQLAVTGDFCGWDAQGVALENIGWGVWQGVLPQAREGCLYKYVVTGADGQVRWKADPYGLCSQDRPNTATRVKVLRHDWQDGQWISARRSLQGPRNIYEVHLGSWRRHEDGSFYSWADFCRELVPYVKDMGYTHVELLPVMEHPFDASWGYQCTGYFAATARFGEPEGLMELIDAFHQAGIGVILDWVPGHFCRDDHGLGMFDGTHLYDDGDMPGWGTYKFNFARYEVRSFLLSSALFWLRVYHADGIRVDGVSSMLYLNFGQSGQPQRRNEQGGEENLGAISFLREFNAMVGALCPGTETYAEESSAWPLVTKPPEVGGLGFHYKWDMGWMNDTLRYMALDFDPRRDNHNLLTFSMMYAFSENYILPLSHDEVVHGKHSLIGRMPGDWWRQFAGARLLQLYAACHPGGMLNFMGNEFAQFIEWRDYESLEWFMLDYPAHGGMQTFVRQLNRVYKEQKALWDDDQSWNGFNWMDPDNAAEGILSFVRRSRDGECVLCVLNFRPETHQDRRIGVPLAGWWQEVLNSDDTAYGGSGKLNPRKTRTAKIEMNGQPQSLKITVPPIGGAIFRFIAPVKTRAAAPAPGEKPKEK